MHAPAPASPIQVEVLKSNADKLHASATVILRKTEPASKYVTAHGFPCASRRVPASYDVIVDGVKVAEVIGRYCDRHTYECWQELCTPQGKTVLANVQVRGTGRLKLNQAAVKLAQALSNTLNAVKPVNLQNELDQLRAERDELQGQLRETRVVACETARQLDDASKLLAEIIKSGRAYQECTDTSSSIGRQIAALLGHGPQPLAA